MLLFLLPVLAVLLVTYIIKSLVVSRNASQLPPGPLGLPGFGYAPFLSSSAHKDYVRLQKKYGNIFGYNHGCNYTVVLGDYKSIKEAYNKDAFIDKPSGFFRISEEYEHIGHMNGWKWQETRRFTLSALKNLGLGKNNVEKKIKEELARDLEKLGEMAEATEVNTHHFFHRNILNNTFTIISKTSFEDSDALLALFSRYMQEFSSKMGLQLYSFHYPFLKPHLWIVELILKKKRSAMQEMEEYIMQRIDSHEKNFDENLQEDFLDYYIKEMASVRGKDTSLTRFNLLGNAQALLIAGSSTTLASLDWNLLCLAKYPEFQDKIYQEIVDVLGNVKLPSWSDKDNLPFTNSFMMEVARFKTISPASDGHWSSEAGTIGHFGIPKDTFIIANVYAVHMDENLWGDPDTFRPDRFLSSDGKRAIAPEYWIPFLTGKRMCPGEKLANMQLFLIVSGIIQKFRVLPPESGLCLQEVDGLFLLAKKPVVTFQRRS